METTLGTVKPQNDSAFPYSLIISIPLPTYRLASSALRALQVDAELSPLVRRSFSLVTPESSLGAYRNGETSVPARNISGNDIAVKQLGDGSEEDKTILRTEYTATTNRMLRVAVNGFMESIGVILDVMKELDLDVLAQNL